MIKINYLRTVAVLFLLSFNSAVYAEKPFAPINLPSTILVDVDATAELIVNTPDLLILDSRKDTEYSKGHIQKAISLPDTDMTLEVLSSHAPDKSTPLLFYCNGERCLRSSRAASQAVDWGYSKIYWFRGGWNEWVDNGMPISRQLD